MKDIMQDLRDLRDNTPCLEEHSRCGCEKFDVIIDKIDEKQTLMNLMILKISLLIDMVEDPTQVYRCEDKNPDGEALDIVINKLKLIINKTKS
jgi:hypothetical protein